ncbi:MAG TPA: hypothetical protein ENN63_00995 [Bacteroidetes bacterium]|nr:hypothetical protein [Bacteroidota bacterium]
MFEGKKGYVRKINKAVKFFSNYDTHLLHSRPLLYKKIEEFDLKISQAPPELAELLWEAHVLLNGFFNGTPFVKLFECTRGVSWGKQVQITKIPAPNPKVKTK